MNEKKNIFFEKISEIELKISKVRGEIRNFRSNGDISENADLVILNEKLGLLEEEYYLLKKEISYLDFNRKDKFITYKVLKENDENDEIRRIQLVERLYADPVLGKISLNSPLGISLSDKSVGQIVKVNVNKHLSYNVLIIKIEE